MSDWGIFGQKGFGKTTLATRMSWEYRNKKGMETIVLDMMRDPRWDTDYLFGSRNEDEHEKERRRFEKCVRNSQGVAVFIDEAWESMDRYDDQFDFLSRVGRHDHRHVHYITHRPVDIDKNTRMFLENLCLFAMPGNYAETLADHFMDPELKNAPNLQKFEFYQTSLTNNAVKKKITPR